eukprot:Sspe_Gene.4125::Locus_1362_Transcript_1_1_Confidence_1.000_Length_1310::g.4125::m.4125
MRTVSDTALAFENMVRYRSANWRVTGSSHSTRTPSGAFCTTFPSCPFRFFFAVSTSSSSSSSRGFFTPSFFSSLTFTSPSSFDGSFGLISSFESTLREALSTIFPVPMSPVALNVTAFSFTSTVTVSPKLAMSLQIFTNLRGGHLDGGFVLLLGDTQRLGVDLHQLHLEVGHPLLVSVGEVDAEHVTLVLRLQLKAVVVPPALEHLGEVPHVDTQLQVLLAPVRVELVGSELKRHQRHVAAVHGLDLHLRLRAFESALVHNFLQRLDDLLEELRGPDFRLEHLRGEGKEGSVQGNNEVQRLL